ncbi:hypothetical protein IWQ62_001554 [Dispira parvispora]|uniref:Uncharacterized protein n=1 Tax=Dispira parvispora TaxID=1520584 RepID=A0A9W8AXK9_9FUNG|nr:hypothetical protein IWQ62_001554 [Dispira parvispora]
MLDVVDAQARLYYSGKLGTPENIKIVTLSKLLNPNLRRSYPLIYIISRHGREIVRCFIQSFWSVLQESESSWQYPTNWRYLRYSRKYYGKEWQKYVDIFHDIRYIFELTLRDIALAGAHLEDNNMLFHVFEFLYHDAPEFGRGILPFYMLYAMEFIPKMNEALIFSFYGGFTKGQRAELYICAQTKGLQQALSVMKNTPRWLSSSQVVENQKSSSECNRYVVHKPPLNTMVKERRLAFRVAAEVLSSDS